MLRHAKLSIGKEQTGEIGILMWLYTTWEWHGSPSSGRLKACFLQINKIEKAIYRVIK